MNQPGTNLETIARVGHLTERHHIGRRDTGNRPTASGPGSEPALRRALHVLEAAGLDFTVVCSGPQPVCPGHPRAVAA